jgi:hypothetical protein
VPAVQPITQRAEPRQTATITTSRRHLVAGTAGKFHRLAAPGNALDRSEINIDSGVESERHKLQTTGRKLCFSKSILYCRGELGKPMRIVPP